MSKRVLLVGHCGPDSSYLKSAVKQANRDVEVRMADDPKTLASELDRGPSLVLFNRELGYDFDDQAGVDWIRRLKKERPQLKTMLVSNYAEAQSEAESAGALRGFGKREIGSSRVRELLKGALEEQK
jgi:hypothetical protein